MTIKTDNNNTTMSKRIGVSPSGGGLTVWVGDEHLAQLDWDQARQLHALLADQLGERPEADR